MNLTRVEDLRSTLPSGFILQDTDLICAFGFLFSFVLFIYLFIYCELRSTSVYTYIYLLRKKEVSLQGDGVGGVKVKFPVLQQSLEEARERNLIFVWKKKGS